MHEELSQTNKKKIICFHEPQIGPTLFFPEKKKLTFTDRLGRPKLCFP
jgi:hypothetical protein